MSQSNTNQNAIAVVGMAGRFPKAASLQEFWANLRDGVDAVSTFTQDELIEAGVAPALLRRSNYVPAKNHLEDADLFDAAFFGYSSSEAALIDPQQRVFLELAWHALENAGYDPAQFDGSIGVFACSSTESYLWRNVFGNAEVRERVNLIQKFVNNFRDFLATRVSYKLSLTGPSMTVQTACSSSLVAVHVACQSLLNFECDMALAGGISITIPRKSGYLYVEGGIGSPDAKCHAFDARAQGCVAGNGGGVVTLKRLEDAIAAGDPIHAVILGSAINNDGGEKAGFTAPSVKGQSEAIALAQANAGISPETITYVEAHGTGTGLGDPIEIEALTRAFSAHTNKTGYCAIGALKTNIGHLDAAAGIAGLIKVCLALRQRQIPAVLHYERPNPKIEFDKTPFFVNTELRSWSRLDCGAPLRAAVSSFGMGGTNAHAVLEEAPLAPAGIRQGHPANLIVLSARTPEALDKMRAHLADFLEGSPGLDLADAAYTLQAGRRGFPHRMAFVAANREEILNELRSGVGSVERAPAVGRAVVFQVPAQGPTAWFAKLFREDAAFCRIAVEAWRKTTETIPRLEGSEPDLSHPALHPNARWLFSTYCLARRYAELGLTADYIDAAGIAGQLEACLREPSVLPEYLAQAGVAQSSTAAPARPEFEDAPVILRFGERSVGDLWQTIASLWRSGARIDWVRHHAGHARRRLALPGYAFARERHWVDPDRPAASTVTEKPAPLGVAPPAPVLQVPAAPQPAASLSSLQLFEEQLQIIASQVRLLRAAYVPSKESHR